MTAFWSGATPLRDVILIALLVLALVVALRLYDRWRSRRIADSEAAYRAALGHSTEQAGDDREGARDPPAATGLSSDEQLIRAVEDFRAGMKAVAAAREAEYESRIADAEKRIEYANTLVIRTCVHKALLTLFKEVRRWPSWIKRDDFNGASGLGLTETTAEEERGPEATLTRVSFVFNSRRYRFEAEENERLSFDGGSKFGRIRLYDNDELVISIETVHDLVSEDDEWRYLSVDALKPGAWVADIVQLEQKIEFAQETWIKHFEAQRLLEQAKNLPKPPT
jgi:hypothetical protein